MDNHFGGVIWTNHALARLQERGISQGDAWATFSHPQQSRFAKDKNAWIYRRNYNGNQIEVVANQNERKEWVIISVWSKQIFPGRSGQYAKPNFLENLVEKIMRKLFGRFNR